MPKISIRHYALLQPMRRNPISWNSYIKARVERALVRGRWKQLDTSIFVTGVQMRISTSILIRKVSKNSTYHISSDSEALRGLDTLRVVWLKKL